MHKRINIINGNKEYVENFLRNLNESVSWSGEIPEKRDSESEEEYNSRLPKIILTSKEFSNDYPGKYAQTMHIIKDLPQYKIILNGTLEKNLKGLEEDLKYFATSQEINFSEIPFRASKYKNVNWSIS
jgi:hypothetical protein